MYYIKPIDNYADYKLDNMYFNGTVKDLKFDDRYNNLWISGKYQIAYNSKLPNFCFYLDVNSDFGYTEKINLNFLRNIEQVKNKKGQLIYSIDEYGFSFNINLNQSNSFNKEITNQAINFEFIPIFNQNVISDFNISVKPEIMYEFIKSINLSRQSTQCYYANSFNLKMNTDYFLVLDPLNNQDNIILNIKAYNINEYSIISNLFKILDIDYFKIIKLDLYCKYNLDSKNPKVINETIENQEIRNKEFNIGFNSWYSFNKLKNEFYSKKAISRGIYSQYDCNVEIGFKLKFEYAGLIRYLNFSNNHQFTTSKANEMKNSLDIKYNDFVLDNYVEVCYEE